MGLMYLVSQMLNLVKIVQRFSKLSNDYPIWLYQKQHKVEA